MAPRRTNQPLAEKSIRTKAPKRMKQIFAGRSFSFSGDFGHNWAHEQMANWIRAHGGLYEREVSEDTTHLVCTIEDYEKKTEQGRS